MGWVDTVADNQPDAIFKVTKNLENYVHETEDESESEVNEKIRLFMHSNKRRLLDQTQVGSLEVEVDTKGD